MEREVGLCVCLWVDEVDLVGFDGVGYLYWVYGGGVWDLCLDCFGEGWLWRV